MTNREVSIVLVNFNGHIDTVECIESILKCECSYHIYVVDNSNNDSSLQYICNWLDGRSTIITTKYPPIVYPLQQKPIFYNIVQESDLVDFHNKGSISLIKANKNLGFAAANNLAIKHILKHTDTHYVWLLNNDTIVPPDSLSQLVKFINEGASDIGIVGSKLLDYHNPQIIQGVGGKYNKWFGLVSEIGSGQIDKGQWDNRKIDFDYVIGASMFLRTEFLKDTGLMNEEYFLYFEELDWAIRAKKRGWKMSFCSNSIVYHKMGASTRDKERKNSSLADFYIARNRILISINYFPYTLISLYISFIVFAINRIKRRQFERVVMLLKVLLQPRRHFFSK